MKEKNKTKQQDQEEGVRLVMIISGGRIIGEKLPFGHIALLQLFVGIARYAVIICEWGVQWLSY